MCCKRYNDTDLIAVAKEKFYDSLDEKKLRTSKKVRNYHENIRLYMRQMTSKDMVSLTELARQYSEESLGNAIQSWMRSRNTLNRTIEIELPITVGISLFIRIPTTEIIIGRV